MFAEVLLVRAAKDIDRAFHYSISKELEDQLKIGHQVVVPFGRRKEVGYVVGFVDQAEVPRVKDILKLNRSEPLFSEQQVALAKWLARHYCSFFVSALNLVIAPGTGKKERIRIGKVREQRAESRKQSQETALEPTQEQAVAINAIKAAVNEGVAQTFLLFGVTGSGKTEVYMQAIETVLAKGKSSIVLVPEISLTPQLVQRFSARFGDSIAALHSHLTIKERKEAWQRISSGEAKIILGARSAVFAPAPEIGLIVLDEEFENSYKQDQSPRYHAREVATFLAKQHQAVLVLGSATPSIETYYRAEQGEYAKLVLSKRIDDRPLPPVEIVDLRQAGGRVLSSALRQALVETVAKGQQAILFLNRRGYFTFAMCRACGQSVECPNCAIALTYHSSEQKLVCNRCGHSQLPPSSCPRCNSSSLVYLGTGTQRIEKEVADILPQARLLRFDRDSVAQRGSHERIFATFAAGKADVLIGTQMVAKGLDVANVTLVGVVSADTALQLPDFRSAEHTFQLLAQVAGRAGRHHLPGRVIIQSYTPEHYAIQAAVKHDYLGFYLQEIESRRDLNYPPFSSLISLMIASKDHGLAEKAAAGIGQALKQRLPEGILGPALAFIPRLRGETRFQVLLKGREPEVLRQALKDVLGSIERPSGLRLTIDVDPQGLI
ncbi:MAG: primosomal protein N' [Candidatus Saganbacteria bacterium]|nr:primosomal protein N' [Candidatus Saganbacteria bacterium]